MHPAWSTWKRKVNEAHGPLDLLRDSFYGRHWLKYQCHNSAEEVSCVAPHIHSRVYKILWTVKYLKHQSMKYSNQESLSLPLTPVSHYREKKVCGRYKIFGRCSEYFTWIYCTCVIQDCKLKLLCLWCVQNKPALINRHRVIICFC